MTKLACPKRSTQLRIAFLVYANSPPEVKADDSADQTSFQEGILLFFHFSETIWNYFVWKSATFQKCENSNVK